MNLEPEQWQDAQDDEPLRPWWPVFVIMATVPAVVIVAVLA